MKLRPCYARQRTRLFIIGQQTDEGESDHPAKTVAQAVKDYEEFDFCEGNPERRGSPFWVATRLLMNQLSISQGCLAWNNLVRMDYERGLPEDEVVELMLDKLPILPKELQICKPDLVVFFTGPNYDPIMDRTFGRVEKSQATHAFPERAVARIRIKGFNFQAYRTYHPKQMNLSGKRDRILGAIVQSYRRSKCP